jgi:hypothetical protein
MAKVESEFEKRALKADLDVNEKVKFRRYLKDLKSKDRKASAWSAMNILSEFIFFWSILTAAMVLAEAHLKGRVSAGVLSYFSMVTGVFKYFEIFTNFVMPYAFISMMITGKYRGDAERERTKMVINIISLVTFAEQKNLLFQMQQYVDTKVDQAKKQMTGRASGI